MAIDRTKPLIVNEFLDLDLTGNATAGYPATQAETDFRGEHWLSDGTNPPVIRCTNNTGGAIAVNGIFLGNVYCAEGEKNMNISYYNGAITIDYDDVSYWDDGKGQIFWWDDTGITLNNTNYIDLTFEPTYPANKVRVGVVRMFADNPIGLFKNYVINSNCIYFKPDKKRSNIARCNPFVTDGGALFTREEKTYLHSVNLDFDFTLASVWENFWYQLAMDQDLRSTKLFISDCSTDAKAAHNAIWGKILDYGIDETSLGGTRVSGSLKIQEL